MTGRHDWSSQLYTHKRLSYIHLSLWLGHQVKRIKENEFYWLKRPPTSKLLWNIVRSYEKRYWHTDQHVRVSPQICDFSTNVCCLLFAVFFFSTYIKNGCEMTKTDNKRKTSLMIKLPSLTAEKVFRLSLVMLMTLVTHFLCWTSADSVPGSLMFGPYRFAQNVELELNFVFVIPLIPSWFYNTHSIWVKWKINVNFIYCILPPFKKY